MIEYFASNAAIEIRRVASLMDELEEIALEMVELDDGYQHYMTVGFHLGLQIASVQHALESIFLLRSEDADPALLPVFELARNVEKRVQVLLKAFDCVDSEPS